MVHFAPVLSICRRSRDPREAGKEPLGKCIHRIGGWLCDNLAGTRGNVEAEEVFDRLQVGSLDSFPRKRCRAMASQGGGSPS